MRKNKLLLLLALLMTAATGAWAQGPWTSGDCTVTFSDGVLTVSGTGAMENYESYNDILWDAYLSDIKTIVIESGVTSIGKYAFTSCTYLESVSIPASVTSIGTYAFENCGSDATTALTVSFAEGSTPLTIGGSAFDYANLKSIDIPNRVTSIGRSAFASCSKLESVSIPASVTSISEEAFWGCEMLANVYIYAPSLTTYGLMAFQENAAGRKIYVLPEAVDTYKAGWPDYAADIEAMNLYATSMKEGTEDADKWTITPNPATAGQTVTATYSGTRRVKSVKAVKKGGAAYTLLSAATTSDCGKVVCAAGHLHDAKTAVPDGCTAVGILGKVTETGHGLILALQNATAQNWNTINGWTSVTTYAGTTLKVLPDDDARGTNLTSYTKLGETAVSNWAVAQKSDYEAIFTNLGSKTADSDGTTYDSNVDAYITTGAGGTAISDESWSATEYDSGRAWDFQSRWWAYLDKDYSRSVRPVLGFGGEAGAPAAKPAATVTTAPTGAAIVGVGKTTALVSGGAAEGGTMMYKVTTENTKPASTDGFSADVPTAQTITASGKVYVWYYVKGDDTHTDSEIAATAIEVPVADIVWDATNVSDLEVVDDAESYTKEGIKLSCNAEDVNAVWYEDEDPTMNGISLRVQASGGFTFTAPTGKKFTKIEMNAVYSNGWDGANLGTGWKFVEDDPNNIYKATWTGSASSTVDLLKDVDDFGGEPVKSIAFYLSE